MRVAKSEAAHPLTPALSPEAGGEGDRFFPLSSRFGGEDRGEGGWRPREASHLSVPHSVGAAPGKRT